MSISSISSSSYQLPDITEMAKNRFKSTDTDGDGAVSKDELTTALEEGAENAPQGVQAPDVDEMFENMDVDGDGSISEEEMTTNMEENGPKGPPPGDGTLPDGVGSKLNITL